MNSKTARMITLNKLFNTGELGRLLSSTFNGRSWQNYPMMDSDFIVTFDDMNNMPSIERIYEVMLKNYSGLGFHLDKGSLPQSPNGLAVCFSLGKGENTLFVVNITINFPHPDPAEKKLKCIAVQSKRMF